MWPTGKVRIQYSRSNSIKSALNQGGRVVKVASKGMVVVPIVLGVCDVIQAPPERRVRTIFEEGFGIVGGYFASELGASLGGFVAISILGLGPLGFFLSVLICASVFGVAGYAASKRLGGKSYEMINGFDGRIINSLDALISSYYGA
jgi:hypothetical protein